jgi:hypothetical protein
VCPVQYICPSSGLGKLKSEEVIAAKMKRTSHVFVVRFKLFSFRRACSSLETTGAYDPLMKMDVVKFCSAVLRIE